MSARSLEFQHEFSRSVPAIVRHGGWPLASSDDEFRTEHAPPLTWAPCQEFTPRGARISPRRGVDDTARESCTRSVENGLWNLSGERCRRSVCSIRSRGERGGGG